MFISKHPFAAGFLAIFLLLALMFGGWAASVALAPVFGFGNAVKKVASADNMLGQYDHFQKLAGDITAEGQQIKLAKGNLADFDKAHGPGTLSFTEDQQRQSLVNAVQGPQQLCASNIQQYNHDAQSIDKAAFKDRSLPDSFDASTCQ